MGIIGSPMGLKLEKTAKFTFPDCLIKKPLIYEMSQVYKVVTNIEKAEVNETEGWVILGVKGTGSEMDKALQWIANQGVIVQMMPPNF